MNIKNNLNNFIFGKYLFIKNNSKKFSFTKLIKLTIKGSISFMLLKMAYSQIKQKNNFELIHTKNELNNYLIKNISPINYIPSFYMYNCLLQLLFNEFSEIPNVKFNRQYQ